MHRLRLRLLGVGSRLHNGGLCQFRVAGDDGTIGETMKNRYCEDCGDEMLTRRNRCKRCLMLVCNWCYAHTHALEMAGFNPPACAHETVTQQGKQERR
jgi:hypothetical protein